MGGGEKSQNDRAWEALFERYDILNRVDREGKYEISAAQIKEYREPRLMAKFDHRINLPQIFAKNRLAILPISRGDYVISRFEAYEPFRGEEGAIARAYLPPSLESLSASHIPSEAIAINCALASGMLADFLGEDRLYPTVSGRMGSGQFDFQIQNVETGRQMEVSVANSQIEIDAAFEGGESLALLEAKKDLSEDFLVRQLYYPFRVWEARISKRVRPIFLVCSNGIFHFYEYAFSDPRSYNSLKLVKQKNYAIEDTDIGMEALEALANRALPVEEPSLPFPQANRFERVINLCELLYAREMSREEVTQEYAFDIRQTNYYTDAARYLGLVEKRRGGQGQGRMPVYGLTKRGRSIMGLNYRNRQLAFCEAVLEHRVFLETFRLARRISAMPSAEEIVRIMELSHLYQVESRSTYVRRASTVSGWIHWMLGLA